MNVKIQTSEKANGNIGSSNNLVNYLMKENQEGITDELFFDYNHNPITPEEVIKSIDTNKKKLASNDAKFYSIILSPSKKELDTINKISNIVEKNKALKQYTSAFMDEYAINFNRDNLNSGDDLVYFAKIERNRKYSGKDPEVKWGNEKSGKIKPGDNTHIHIVVSRKDKTQKLKLSPLTHHKKTKKGPVKGGFIRTNLFRAAEKTFDLMFEHHRELSETFDYYNTKSKEEKLMPGQYESAKELELVAANLYMDNFDLMELNRKKSLLEIFEEKKRKKVIKPDKKRVIKPEKRNQQNKGFSM